jgi:predicted nucleic acid-binding protein
MIVLDTNVLSEAMKPLPHPAVAAWMARQNAEDLFTTAVAEAEILLGVAILPDGKRKQDLAAAAQQIFGLFAGRILAFHGAAAEIFATIVAERRRIGRPIGAFDAQIGAIARSNGMALATRNVADFDGIGVTVIDPWRA